MTPPPSDPSNQTKKKGAPFKFLVPLIYAPALPLIRLALRHRPVLRDRLFTGVLAGAFAHGIIKFCSCTAMHVVPFFSKQRWSPLLDSDNLIVRE